MEGTRIGPYLLGARLGKGGAGEVYVARDGDREVAIKLIPSGASAKELLRFRIEAEVMSRVRHPNVVRIERLIEHDGRLFIVMERLHGRDLRDAMKEWGALPFARVLEIVEPICSALHEVHEAGVVHRDVKASNVFLEEERVVLLDFGIAKVIGATSTTLGGLMPGTPQYMAPEQLLGRAIDRRTDVYALAVLTFLLLTGKHPFTHQDPRMVCQLHLHAQRPKPSSRRSEIPASTDEVVVRAMSRNPDKRPSTALQLLDQLRGTLI